MPVILISVSIFLFIDKGRAYENKVYRTRFFGSVYTGRHYTQLYQEPPNGDTVLNSPEHERRKCMGEGNTMWPMPPSDNSATSGQAKGNQGGHDNVAVHDTPGQNSTGNVELDPKIAMQLRDHP